MIKLDSISWLVITLNADSTFPKRLKNKEKIMLVKLPRPATGLEIVEFFKTASTFNELPDVKLKGKVFIGEYQYEHGSVRQAVRSMGVRVSKLVFEKRFTFFGSKVWKNCLDLQFTLSPIVLDKKFEEINVDVEYVYSMGEGGNWIAKDPSHPHFEDIRPIFEKILARFFSQLQPVAA